MNRLPPLKAMQVFEATARHLSFSRAADELCVSQSAVSHQIKSLENFLGQKLLIRNNSSVSLTSEGDTFYSVVKDCFKRMQTITNHLTGETSLKLRVMAQTSIAIDWLAPRLFDFKEKHPAIEIDLAMASVDHEFDPSDFDIIIGTWPVPANFVTQTIRTELWFPVCSKEQYTKIDPNSPESLLTEPLISSEKGQDWELWAQHQQLNLNYNASIQYVSHTLLAAKTALGGYGIALSCDFIADQAIKEGKLIPIRQLSYNLPWGHYNIHYQIGNYSIDKIEAFTKWVIEKAEKNNLTY